MKLVNDVEKSLPYAHDPEFKAIELNLVEYNLKKKTLFLIGNFLIGLVLFPIVNSFFITKYICMMLSIIAHELGHTVVALLYGNLAIPFVDFFLCRGGITIIFEGVSFGVIFGIAIFSFLIYIFRKKTFLVIILAVMILLLLGSFSNSGKDLFITSAGHIFEVLFVGVAFYLCLVANLKREYEKPIYSVIAWWVLIYHVDFFGTLRTSIFAVVDYINYSIVSPDLIKIGDNLNTTGIQGVASFFMYLFFVPPIIVVILAVKKLIRYEL